MMKPRLVRGLCFLVFIFCAVYLPRSAAAEPVVLDGIIEPYLIVNIGSPVAGILATVDVDRGDIVTRNQVLATLQSGVERANMELARTRVEMDASVKAKEAKLNFNLRRQQRLEPLLEKNLIPFDEMDEARTNTDLALLELEEARENIRLAEMEWKRANEVVKRMTIYSPITGVVKERFLTKGEYVENQPILQLVQIDPLYVEVFAPVALLGIIAVNMTAEVSPEEPIGNHYKARVKVVDRVVDAASGTFGVRLELPNPGNKLPAGLKCKVSFPTGR
jgi:RND family efflux transporter MFP subunit